MKRFLRCLAMLTKPFSKSLYKEILKIPAINNHMHYNDEETTIDWYLHKLPGKTNVMTSGVLNGLKKLLNISGKITDSNKTAIKKKYLKKWLEVCPPWNILFGIDATGLAQFRGNWCEKKALAITLARMLKEHQITDAEAHGIAYGIMRNNALRFYESTWT